MFYCYNALAGSDLYFIHNDHLNTPQALSNINQNIAWEVTHQSPFGELEVNDDVDGNGERIEFNIRFPGQYFDVESGTSYNYYRTYDSTLGRYIQSDPIGLNGGINTYAYVEGSPLKYSDPKGLCGQGLCVGVAAAAVRTYCTRNPKSCAAAVATASSAAASSAINQYYNNIYRQPWPGTYPYDHAYGSDNYGEEGLADEPAPHDHWEEDEAKDYIPNPFGGDDECERLRWAINVLRAQIA